MSPPEGAASLRPAIYDPAAGEWRDAEHAAGSPADATTLTVVSWNVWFGARAFDARAEALLDRVERCGADVVGLQEVTPPFLERLLARPAIREGYWVSDASGRTLGHYGTLLLGSRRAPAQALWQRDLGSRMGRTLLCAEVAFAAGAPPLAVATVHLESLRHNADARGEQLEAIQPLLRGLPGDAVLFGDFNFCSTWADENHRIHEDFVDVWPAVHGGAPGYTEDTDINAMLLHKEGKEKQVRFDRVLLRSPGRDWRPRSICLLGTEPILPSMPDIFPSDHFGLEASFERSAAAP